MWRSKCLFCSKHLKRRRSICCVYSAGDNIWNVDIQNVYCWTDTTNECRRSNVYCWSSKHLERRHSFVRWQQMNVDVLNVSNVYCWRDTTNECHVPNVYCSKHLDVVDIHLLCLFSSKHLERRHSFVEVCSEQTQQMNVETKCFAEQTECRRRHWMLSKCFCWGDNKWMSTFQMFTAEQTQQQ